MPNGQQRQVQAVVTESVWAKQLPSNQNWNLWTWFCSPKIHLFLFKTMFTFAFIGTPGPERGLRRYLWFSKSLCRIGQRWLLLMMLQVLLHCFFSFFRTLFSRPVESWLLGNCYACRSAMTVVNCKWQKIVDETDLQKEPFNCSLYYKSL